MIRRKDFNGDHEATGFVCEMRLRRVRRWSGRKISKSLRLVMMRVLEGGEGDGIGGMVDRSIERFDRDERAEDDRDVGDGVRFMLFVFVFILELPVLIVGSCSMVEPVGQETELVISRLQTTTFQLHSNGSYNSVVVLVQKVRDLSSKLL